MGRRSRRQPLGSAHLGHHRCPPRPRAPRAARRSPKPSLRKLQPRLRALRLEGRSSFGEDTRSGTGAQRGRRRSTSTPPPAEQDVELRGAQRSVHTDGCRATRALSSAQRVPPQRGTEPRAQPEPNHPHSANIPHSPSTQSSGHSRSPNPGALEAESGAEHARRAGPAVLPPHTEDAATSFPPAAPDPDLEAEEPAGGSRAVPGKVRPGGARHRGRTTRSARTRGLRGDGEVEPLPHGAPPHRDAGGQSARVGGRGKRCGGRAEQNCGDAGEEKASGAARPHKQGGTRLSDGGRGCNAS